ncbi:LuxR C-terminal-related transcriptional regulator [Actinomadura fibrosa]|uniref:LuxR C-terminal-related transcriptional regulator n=1 Tax=Actinomadura fibrosa TaxID=111802 RepID=A0ABW2XRG1_9ACTN|nr:LuxR C-terminal-related transcriptional regulator [Actinomadura fibrosa]
MWSRLAADPRTFAWLSLREADDEPGPLWTAIVAALARKVPGLDGDRLSALTREPGFAGEDVLPLLLSALAAHPGPLLLVLDDHHVLRDPECQRQLGTFVDRLPPTVQIAMVGRTRPAFPLTRYRASGETRELRMGELRMSGEEVRAMVRETAGILLRDADVEILAERTEGWPIAVRLAALGLREAADPAAFVSGFTGANREVAEYVDEEVLRSLAPDARAFLLRTSILDELSAAVCQEVTGLPDAARRLEEMERAGLFLVPLDDHRAGYRYHRLFREALRCELSRDDESMVAALHLRASAWYARHGMIRSALDHALAGGDTRTGGDLLARHYMDFISAGRSDLVRGWLAAIGEPRVSQSAALAICAAWAHSTSGDRMGTRRWLRTAEGLPEEGRLPDGSPSAKFAVALVKALHGGGSVPELAHAAATAAALAPDPTSEWSVRALTILGYARYLAGDLEGALGPLKTAAQDETEPPLLRLLALAGLSLTLGELGQGAESGRLARSAYKLLREHGLLESPLGTPASTAFGLALAREGMYARAREVLEEALRIRRRRLGLTTWTTLDLLLAAARTTAESGDHSAARKLLAEARRLLAAEPDEGPRFRALLDRLEAPPAGPPPAARVPESLTGREHEVLRLLPAELSMREIADELYVSTNTVKTHTRAIYRKLGASTRQQALHRARELGIL